MTYILRGCDWQVNPQCMLGSTDVNLVFSVSRVNCRFERVCIIQTSSRCLGCAMTLAHFRLWCPPG